MRCALGEPDFGQQPERPVTQFGARDAERRKCHLDVLNCRQGGDQVEVLEDEAESPEPQLGEIVVAQRGEVASLEEDVAVARPVERTEELEAGVVLPEPLGPSSATNSPAAIDKLTSSTARTSVPPFEKTFDALLTS